MRNITEVHYQFEPLLRKISSDFIKSSVHNAQSSLYNALSEAGMALQVDKIRLLRQIPSSCKLISLAQWVKKTEFFDHTNLEGYTLDIEQHSYWKTFVDNPRPLIMNSLQELGREAQNEVITLKAEGILSHAAFPVNRGNRLIGCISVATIEKEKTWHAVEIDFLQRLSELFSDFLERVEMEADGVINSCPDAEVSVSDAEARELFLSQSQMISKAGLDLMHMQSKEKVMEFSARLIHNLFPKSLVSVSEYQQENNTLTTRHLKGLDQRIRKVLTLLAIELEGKTFTLDQTQQEFRLMEKSLLYRIKGGLQEATLGSIGPVKSRILESICNLKTIYGAGFMANGKLYGTLILILRENTPVLEGLMDSFIRMVSMSLYRIETQQDLIFGQNYLKSIFSAMTEGVVEIDLNGKIGFANKSAFNFTGYHKSELIGKSVGLFLANDNSYEVLATNTIGGMPTERRCFEINVKAKTGYILPVIVNTIMVRDPSGNPRGFLGVLTDLSRLREKERALHEMEIHQKLLEYKQQFLSNMSHEMYTPFNGILGVTQLLKNTISEPQNQELLDIISDSTTQLLRIIKSIWETNGLKEGALGLNKREFNLCGFLHQNLKLFVAAAKEREADLFMHCHRTVDYLLEADELRINQVLTNLMGNAFKFLNHGGRVDVRCDLLFKPDQTAWMRLEVEDNGPGIPPEKQQKIFELLEQVDNSNTRKHDGLGLGLHLSSQLIGLMQGSKGFESTPMEGSRFWFEVPVRVIDTIPISSSSICQQSQFQNGSFAKCISVREI